MQCQIMFCTTALPGGAQCCHVGKQKGWFSERSRARGAGVEADMPWSRKASVMQCGKGSARRSTTKGPASIFDPVHFINISPLAKCMFLCVCVWMFECACSWVCVWVCVGVVCESALLQSKFNWILWKMQNNCRLCAALGERGSLPATASSRIGDLEMKWTKVD